MLIKAEQKFVRTSPTKLRFVAQTIKGNKNPEKALFYLESMNKLAAVPLAKTLKQAVANAKNNHGLNPDTLVIRELSIGEGPVYKRGIPVSRGRFHPIVKKTAHIRVIVEDVVVVTPKVMAAPKAVEATSVAKKAVSKPKALKEGKKTAEAVKKAK
jgi:large subunit ribosomal protein L22